MKCPRCWAEKAYVYPMEGWKGILLDCLFLTRMKCRHCFHKFTIPWVLTIGKQVTPPVKAPPSRAVEGPAVVPYARTPQARQRSTGSRRRVDAA